ncbi:phosphatase PAP2 family protein [Pandoraea sp. SD6-2]|uniref:phosphatase PAP2 family protein n=1 Tax=Pandoraea sp. SD6-2 TaxID=1286093 RepID=UPI00032FC672|nr:phosphatase PAP2 family protein [Pandoraea sp. SD6-2]EON13740.1 hypothetical protein C266_09864 [Pandoraea sp. SD6-2]
MNWLQINLTTVALAALALGWLGMGVELASLAMPGLACLALACLWAVYTWCRPDARIGAAAGHVIGLIVFTHAAAALDYAVVATGAPLVDQVLTTLDGRLGFDWTAWHATVRGSRMLSLVLPLAYDSGMPQIALVVLLLSFTGRFAELRQFANAMTGACLATIAISGLIPAAGAFVHFGGSPGELATLSHFAPLRAHTLTVVDLSALQGLISMPSFHAVMAVLLAYAVRRCRAAFAVLAPLNALVLLSTLSEGGHYLVDVLAGIALAIVAIKLTRRHGVPLKTPSLPTPALTSEPVHERGLAATRQVSGETS